MYATRLLSLIIILMMMLCIKTNAQERSGLSLILAEENKAAQAGNMPNLKSTNDAFWRQSFKTRGISGISGTPIIYDSESLNGKLYAAGRFDYNNGEAMNAFMVWDGIEWSNLGTSLEGYVLSLEIDGDNLILTGSFTEISSGANNLVVYNTNNGAFSAFNGTVTNFDGIVRTSMVKGDSLYVGGNFETIDGQPMNGFSLWNGSDWEGFGTGVNSRVYSIFKKDNNLFVGGKFIIFDNKIIENLAVFDGTTWSEFGGGSNDLITNIEELDNTLYVMGNFDELGGTKTGGLARWTGVNWEAFEDTLFNVWDVEMYEGELHAAFPNAGSSSDSLLFGLAKYAGNKWQPVGNYMQGGGLTLSVFENELFAGGYLFNTNPKPLNGYALWNGIDYKEFRSGADYEFNGVYGTIDDLAKDENYLYVGGTIRAFGDNVTASTIARWDGDNWSNMGNGLKETVRTLLNDGNELYVGTDSGIHVWNKTSETWTKLGNTNSSVQALAKAGSNVYAGGYFTSIEGTDLFYIARWNGSSWQPLEQGLSSSVETLAIHNGELYAGGSFKRRVGMGNERGIEYIAKWNGSSWSGLSSGLNGRVKALFSSDSVLYVGGDFTADSGAVGSNVYNHIAYWDGTDFNTMGGGVNNGGLNDISSYQNKIYLAGYFSSVGIFGANIATWNNQELEALDRASGGTVTSLSEFNDELVVGGYFEQVGQDVVSSGIAFWNGAALPATVSLISPDDQASNVVPENIAFSWTAASFAEQYELEIATNMSFTENVESYSSVSPEITVSSLDAETTYYWRARSINANGSGAYSSTRSFSTSVMVSNEGGSQLPRNLALNQNYPNPFNPTTQIQYDLPKQTRVTLTVFNMLGQKVSTLINEVKPAGRYTVNFDASKLASGLYVYQLSAGEEVLTKKMMVIK